MSPKLHIERFLEEVRGRYSRRRWEDFGSILRLYAKFLENRGYATIKVLPEVVDEYLASLYRRCCYARLTLRNHANHLRIFYEHARARDAVEANPVQTRARDFLPSPLKDRSYNDEELTRAFVQDWRALDYCPIFYPELEKVLRKVQTWLKDQRLRLQRLAREDLLSFAQYLESYRKADGGSLRYAVKQVYFQYARWISRWLYRNGYRPDDPTEGLHFTFSEAYIEGRPPALAPLWAELKLKFFQDHQGLWRPSTFPSKDRSLKEFFWYLEELGLQDVHQINVEVLEKFRARVYERADLSEGTKWAKMMVVRGLMNWLEKRDMLLSNPIRKMNWPKRAHGIPTRLMSEHELKILMNAPDLATPIGLRNRAIFELMYSTGVRFGELSGIRLQDIDFENGLIRVEKPKGGPEYQRVIPTGHISLDWIKRYLDQARSQFPKKRAHENLLFLTKRGGPLTSICVNQAMRQYAFKLGMRRKYSSHSWRVTCATEMLRNRADIRHVQEQLGHRSLESTKLYTRLCPVDLKKVHERTHPREKEWRKMQKKISPPAPQC